MNNIMIVTDLDGTLLDHYTYSFAAALPMLSALKDRGIPVVLCSSKTREEIQLLREQLSLDSPYIVENGAAVYFPKRRFPALAKGSQPVSRDGATEWCHEFGGNRAHWQSLLDELPDVFYGHYRRLSSMTVGQISDLTGLSPDDAARASRREYGEPVQWRGSDTLKEEFIAALETKGARVLQGGRFLHIAGGWDKGLALHWLASRINGPREAPPVTIALGDSQNDVAMLEAADHAVVVKSPVHGAPKLTRAGDVVHTVQTGPQGWSEGLQKVLETIDCEEVTHG